MRENNISVVTLPVHSELAENLVEFMQLDPAKSFKGWLTSLTSDQFLEVQKAFDEQSHHLFCIIYARLTGKSQVSVTDSFDSVGYLNARLLSYVDLAEIGLYRKGYTELVSRDNGLWIFKPTQKGNDYLTENGMI